MLEHAAALAPIFLLIGLGYGLRLIDLPGAEVWGPVERLTYLILLPSLLVRDLSQADLAALSALPLVAASALAYLVLLAALMAMQRPLRLSGPAHGAFVQGVVRSNSFIGLAAASTILGAEGRAAMALVITLLVPLTNVLSVWALARQAGAARPSPWLMARMILTNPMVIACIIGGTINALHIPVPTALGQALGLLAAAALPLGLLAVGAALDLRVALGVPSLAASLLKLLAAPALMAAAAWCAGLTGVARSAAILFCAMPNATSAYILARQMGGDARLAAAIVTVSTILSAASIPLVADLFLGPG